MMTVVNSTVYFSHASSCKALSHHRQTNVSGLTHRFSHGKSWWNTCSHSNILLFPVFWDCVSTAPKWSPKAAPTNGTGLAHLCSPKAALVKCCSWGSYKWCSIYHHLESKTSSNKQNQEDGELLKYKVDNCSGEKFCKKKKRHNEVAIPLWEADLEKSGQVKNTTFTSHW